MAIFQIKSKSYFWGCIDKILNAIYCPIIDQKQFQSKHKQKYSYKYESIITLNSLVSGFIGLLIGCQRNSKILKYSDFITRLRDMNCKREFTYFLYLYDDLVYSTIYKIIEFYKNYTNHPYIKGLKNM